MNKHQDIAPVHVENRNPKPGTFVFKGMITAENINRIAMHLKDVFEIDTYPDIFVTGTYEIANKSGHIPLSDAKVLKTNRKYITVEIGDKFLFATIDPSSCVDEESTTTTFYV